MINIQLFLGNINEKQMQLLQTLEINLEASPIAVRNLNPSPGR